MFAVRIRHPVTDQALGAERAAFDEAARLWCGWLEAQDGCAAVVVLAEGRDEVSLMSVWVDEQAFASAIGDPSAMAQAAPLSAFFSGPATPEAVPVLYFRGAG